MPTGKDGAESARFSGAVWMDLVIPALAAPTGTDGTEEARIKAEVDQIRKMVKVSDFDLKPAFLYFHYPHDDDVKERKLTPEGRVSKKTCELLVEEEIARWALLFRCFEVDMSKSDRAAATRVGAGTGTSFAVVNGKTQVVGQSGPFANAKAAAAFLRDSLKTASPDLWTDIQRQLDEQKKVLDEARALAAKKDWKAAKERYELVVKSDLRVGDWWDGAAKEYDRIVIKAEGDR